MAKQRLTKEQRIKKRKRTRRKLIGFTIFALSILGIAFIVTMITNRIAVLLDNSGEKEYYGNLYTPIVAMDPVAFTSIENADPDLLLEAAIWAAFNGEDSSKFQRTEDGRIIIPVIDVDRYATRLYGPNYRLSHRTFTDVTDGSLVFTYDSSTESYIMPITSQAGSYTPVVESITTSGKTKTLRIAYIQTDSEISSNYVTGTVNYEAAKYMDYILLRTDGEYYLYAVATVTPGD